MLEIRETPAYAAWFAALRDPGLIQSSSKVLDPAVAVPSPSAPQCRASRSAYQSESIETPPIATGLTPPFGDFP